MFTAFSLAFRTFFAVITKFLTAADQIGDITVALTSTGKEHAELYQKEAAIASKERLLKLEQQLRITARETAD